jgi:hypothetical protein
MHRCNKIDQSTEIALKRPFGVLSKIVHAPLICRRRTQHDRFMNSYCNLNDLFLHQTQNAQKIVVKIKYQCAMI